MKRADFIVILTFLITSASLAAPQSKDVDVVNMSPVNATVTGTIDTNIVNTPIVNELQNYIRNI